MFFLLYMQVLTVLLPREIFLFRQLGLKKDTIQDLPLYKSLEVIYLQRNKISLHSTWLLGMVIMSHIRWVAIFFPFLKWRFLSKDITFFLSIYQSHVLVWDFLKEKFDLQYELSKFCPFNTVLVDHGDPSINTGRQTKSSSRSPLSVMEYYYSSNHFWFDLSVSPVPFCSSHCTNR